MILFFKFSLLLTLNHMQNEEWLVAEKLMDYTGFPVDELNEKGVLACKLFFLFPATQLLIHASKKPGPNRSLCLSASLSICLSQNLSGLILKNYREISS